MIFQLGFLLLLVGLASAKGPLTRETIGHSTSRAVDYRLPNYLTVHLYTLELEPNFVTDTFIGSVSIQFTVTANTTNITLHTSELAINVNSISLLNASGTIVNTVIGTSYSNDDRHFFTVYFAQSLNANQTFTLVIGAFSGIINEDLDGFYLARYVNENFEIVKLGTTQFQPTGARRAFPCFDEPALKAYFDIAIIRTSERHSLSNAPLINTTQITPGRFLDIFERTARMSTYLVAFVVSDFTYVGRENHRVYARPEAIADGRGEHSLQASFDILEAVEDFVNIPYSLPKIDQIAIPDNYYTWGAMENWGLVTYREEFLMFVENVTASSLEEFIAIIIAHEYGHQWFGNLVSPFWWTYLWLNEGFAAYFEYTAPSGLEEDLELEEQVVIKSVQFSLDRDNTATTRPMSLDAGSPADIYSLFDVVAYDKAGSVIRMFEAVLSAPVFRRGLTIFLNNRQYDYAVPSDLYSAWQAALSEFNLQVLPVNETVESVLTTWELNAGYPLVTVTRNYQNGTVQFTQRRFISTDPNNQVDSIWYIPITYATPNVNQNFSNTSTQLWLTARNTTVYLPGLNVTDWLIVNVQQRGYFRVNYDTESWNRIITLLHSNNYAIVHQGSRAQLIHDVFHFARYGIIDYQIALNLSLYLVRETEYIPIYPFIDALAFLNTYLANTPVYSNFQAYILTLLNESYNSVGTVENASNRHTVKLNRVNVVNWVCRFGSANCRIGAQAQLAAWRNNSDNFIVPNLQTVVTCAALINGTQDDWNFVYAEYLNRPEVSERSRLLNALGCSENAQILAGFVNLVVNITSNFPFADRLAALASIYNSGNFGRDFVFNYTRENYGVVSTSFTQAQVSAILNGIASRFSNQNQVTELLNFAISVGETGNLFINAINTAVNNFIWATENLGSVQSWLAQSRYAK